MRPGQAYGPARGGPGARVASLISKSRWQQVSGGERRDWELMQQPPARSPAATACMAAFYLPATPASQLSHNGIDPAAMQPVLDLIAAGDISAAARTLPPEVAAAQCGAGTPQQCATQIADTFLPAGFNHLGFGLVDGRIVKTLTGTDRRGERGPPEARRPSRSSSPPGYWASTRLTASRSSTLRPESPRPAEAKCYRRAAARYPGHPGPRRHADDPVADGPASVSVRPARRPGLGYLNTYGEGNVMNHPEPPTVAPQPTVTYGGPGPVPRLRTDNRPPGPRCRPKPWRPW